MANDANGSATKARGYDEPATDDLLDRRPLARAIADVVSDTPPEFGVRVGLFGEWGSGKSSVLNFIEQILGERGHVVVRFSPWGIVDRSQLWAKLGETLLAEFDKRGEGERVSKGTRFTFKFDQVIRDGLQAGRKLVENVPYVGRFAADVVAGPVLDSVRTILNNTQQQLASFAKAGERIVVMIDDVDRADPALVPPMLFALRELFDVPRFSWILAIDPVVVRAALTNYHPGFGLGRDFLEKIVDFPFSLAAPEPARRAELLDRELPDAGIVLKDGGLTDIAAWLPDNPRELRSIVRHLRSISRTLTRLGPDGFDQHLLLVLVVIHSAAPQLLMRLLASPKVLNKLTGLKFLDGERAKEAYAIAKTTIKPLLSASGLPAHDRKRLRSLLLRLCDGGYWTAELVIETGRLLHTAPTMTAREATEGVALSADASTLRNWLEGFAKAEDRSEQEVRTAFFRQLLALHNRSMEKAIESFAHDDTRDAVRAVTEIIRAVELLLFDIGNAADLGPAGLEEMRQAFSRWAHFRHPEDYIPGRSAERECLLRFARLPELDPLEALDRVRPGSGLRDDVDTPGGRARFQLNQDLLDALEPRATDAFIGHLDKENLVAYFRGWKRAGKFLMRTKSRLWTLDVRPQLREMLEREKSTARADNTVDLLHTVLNMSEEARRAILSDADLVNLLWSTATAVAPNMRRFTSFEELKKTLETASGLTLSEPTWWQNTMAQQRAAARSEDSESSEGEDAPTPLPPPTVSPADEDSGDGK